MNANLEKAIQYLLNEEHDKAEAELHRFIVEKARQIHESYRTEDDLDETFGTEMQLEKYFDEADVTGLEDLDTDLDLDLDIDADVEGEKDVEADMDMEGDEAGEGDDDLEDRFEDIEDEMADLEAQLERLTAEFEAMMNGEDKDEDMSDEADMDMDMDMDGMDDMDLDLDDEDEVKEGKLTITHEDEDDFADITEAVIDELDRVMMEPKDDVEIDGKTKVNANKKSGVGDRSKAPKAPPVKGQVHTSFEREPAPPVKDMKARTNTKKKANDTLSAVPKGGAKKAILNDPKL